MDASDLIRALQNALRGGGRSTYSQSADGRDRSWRVRILAFVKKIVRPTRSTSSVTSKNGPSHSIPQKLILLFSSAAILVKTNGRNRAEGSDL
jgi:hypothetical protein